jgi:hypothetical protein
LNGYNNGANWDQTSWYAGVTLNTPAKSVKVGASYSYLGTTDFGTGDDNYANAVAGYLSWQLTEKLSLHGRGEYVSTDTGLFGTGTAIEPGGNSEIFALTGRFNAIYGGMSSPVSKSAGITRRVMTT